MAVRDRACTEQWKLVKRDKGHNNTLPAPHLSSECGHQEARAKSTNQVMQLPSLLPTPWYQWKGNWVQGPEGRCKQILLTRFQPHLGVHEHTDEEEASACVTSLMAVEGGRKEQDLMTANFSCCRQGTQSAAQIMMVKATLRNFEEVMMPDSKLGSKQVY